MSAPAHAIVKRQLSINLPLILRIPLKEVQLAIREVSGFRFGVSIEITQQRIRIREVCISGAQSCRGRDGEAVAGAVAEVQSA